MRKQTVAGIEYITSAIREALGDNTWHILTDDDSCISSDILGLGHTKHAILINKNSVVSDDEDIQNFIVISQDESGQHGYTNDNGVPHELHLDDHSTLLRQLKHLWWGNLHHYRKWLPLPAWRWANRSGTT